MRKIIHIDADCFFAALEMRDEPSLRHVPMAVGGSSMRRGVIATCNYPARAFGVRSAMASSMALRLCPDLVFRASRFEVYREASKAMLEIFSRYSDAIEPLSLDEAYIDVTDAAHCQGSATLIAKEIRASVERELGITVSAGVASNKLLAKIASDWQKPNGLTVVQPKDNDAFSRALPVAKLRGVGAVTAGKLEQMGVQYAWQLREVGLQTLEERFGKFGYSLYEQAHGRDERPVKASRERKSLGVEKTFAEGLAQMQCFEALAPLKAELLERLAKRQCLSRIAKVFVKVKFADFTSTTAEGVCSAVDGDAIGRLLSSALTRSKLAVRLLGVGVRLTSEQALQLPLFEQSPSWQLTDGAG